MTLIYGTSLSINNWKTFYTVLHHENPWRIRNVEKTALCHSLRPEMGTRSQISDVMQTPRQWDSRGKQISDRRSGPEQMFLDIFRLLATLVKSNLLNFNLHICLQILHWITRYGTPLVTNRARMDNKGLL